MDAGFEGVVIAITGVTMGAEVFARSKLTRRHLILRIPIERRKPQSINSVDHMIAAVTRKGLIFAAASALIGVTMLAGAFAQTRKLGDGLSSEGAGALFAGSGQKTTLDCAGAHIFGSNNTLILTGGCTWLDMVGSNNTIIVALAEGANIEFAGSNNAITWTSPDGKEPAVRHLGSGNTLTAGH
jgi:hypothetical protein